MVKDDVVQESQRPTLSLDRESDSVDAFVKELQSAIDAGNASHFNRHFAQDVLWGSPFGAVAVGFDQIHAIHSRMFAPLDNVQICLRGGRVVIVYNALAAGPNSLGVPAVFLFGGLKRADKAMRVPVRHGDVIVWGGPARLRYHGVMPLEAGQHPLLGACRINLTFRKAR